MILALFYVYKGIIRKLTDGPTSLLKETTINLLNQNVNIPYKITSSNDIIRKCNYKYDVSPSQRSFNSEIYTTQKMFVVQI